jgi:hypothetical protein
MSINDPSDLNSALSGCDALKILEIINRSISCASENDFAGLFPIIQELKPLFTSLFPICIYPSHKS